MVFTASLLAVQYEVDGIENKSASSLVVFLSETLGGFLHVYAEER